MRSSAEDARASGEPDALAQADFLLAVSSEHEVWAYGNAAGQEVALRDFRKDITITQLGEAGEPVASYTVLCCWVSEYTAMPELDASGTAVAIQSITLQHEGWQRDPSVAEPTEPSV